MLHSHYCTVAFKITQRILLGKRARCVQLSFVCSGFNLLPAHKHLSKRTMSPKTCSSLSYFPSFSLSPFFVLHSLTLLKHKVNPRSTAGKSVKYPALRRPNSSLLTRTLSSSHHRLVDVMSKHVIFILL